MQNFKRNSASENKSLFLTKLFNVLLIHKINSCEYSQERNCKKEERRTRAFSAAEHFYKKASGFLSRHKWFVHFVNKKTTKKISNRNCKELQYVSCRKNSSLNFNRDIFTHYSIQVCTHKWN